MSIREFFKNILLPPNIWMGVYYIVMQYNRLDGLCEIHPEETNLSVDK